MPLLKPKEIAIQLGIGYPAVLDLFHSGELPNVRIPGRVENADRRQTGPIVMKPRRSYRADQADVDALILKWKSGENIGPNSGPMVHKQGPKTQQNAVARPRAQSGIFVVKPLWYKQFQNGE